MSPTPPSAYDNPPRWTLATCLAFRFCFLYLGLFVILEFLTIPAWILFNPIPNARIAIGDLPPFRTVVVWVAQHIFHLAHPETTFVYETNGSLWIQVFCILVVAIAGTVLWSILGREQTNYVKLHQWFRVAVIVWLGALMFFYGTAKVIPVQMWFPRLSRLLERFGDFSPMAVLWNSMGASAGYLVFTGWAEVVGGLLLYIPGTTLLGALICAADMANVLTLNMSYDVNVKGLSLHLLLMSAFLIAPDAQRLANLFVLRRGVDACVRATLFQSGRANNFAQAVILIVGLVFLAGGLNSAMLRYRTEVAPERPPLYGIWTVEDFTLDGENRPPLVTDDLRWRLVVFESIYPWVRRDEVFQRGKFAHAEEMHVYGMDDAPKEFDLYVADPQPKGGLAIVNSNAGTLELYRDSMDKFSLLSYTQPASDQLVIDGAVNGHQIHARMKLFNISKFYLVGHANELNWVGSGTYR